MKRILLAEDDLDFGKMLKQYLILNKYEVVWAKDGNEAWESFKEETFDICILDVMMPHRDGFSLAKLIIKEHPEIPFLFLTARRTKEDRIKGLKLGADDYIAKPFEIEELLLRLKNILRRTELQQSMEEYKLVQEPISMGTYQLDVAGASLSHPNETRKMTARETKLLYYLYTHRNQLIKREDILLRVWGKADFFSGRSMDVFISRLRKYLKHDSTISIESVRGVGLELKIN